MAILVEFEKLAETDRAVEYSFGKDGRMDRRLTIDKSSREAKPADGNHDKSFSTAYGKILQDLQRLGHWPARGGHQA